MYGTPIGKENVADDGNDDRRFQPPPTLPHGHPGDVEFDQDWREVTRNEVIKMNPVELDGDELQYELALRQLDRKGSHRDRTGRLRRAIEEERRNPAMFPQFSHLPWDKDAMICDSKLNRVQKMLGQAHLIPTNLAVLCTLIAHVEGRVGRLFPRTESQREATRELQTRKEDLLHIFLNRLRTMAESEHIHLQNANDFEQNPPVQNPLINFSN